MQKIGDDQILDHNFIGFQIKDERAASVIQPNRHNKPPIGHISKNSDNNDRSKLQDIDALVLSEGSSYVSLHRIDNPNEHDKQSHRLSVHSKSEISQDKKLSLQQQIKLTVKNQRTNFKTAKLDPNRENVSFYRKENGAPKDSRPARLNAHLISDIIEARRIDINATEESDERAQMGLHQQILEDTNLDRASAAPTHFVKSHVAPVLGH